MQYKTDLLNLLVRLWRHLNRRRQRQFLLLLGLMVVSAFAQIVSLGAVVPFLGMLVAPENVFNHPIVMEVAMTLGIVSANQLVLPLTVVFAAASLIACVIQVFLLWANTRLAVVSGSELSIEVYRRTLYQPFHVHVARNSSEVISGISGKINGVVLGVLFPLLTFVSAIMLLLAIMLTLFAINPMVASFVAIGFGCSYALVSWMSRRQLHRNSQRIAYEQNQVIKALQEGLGGIRDVLLDGTQPLYCNIYRNADIPLRLAMGNNNFIAGSPRPIMEALGVVLIAVLTYVLSQQDGGIATALPVLGALALGAQRLLPALQQSYAAWASIVGNQASLVDILDLLEQPLPAELLQPIPAPLLVKDSIRFRAVRFRYTSKDPWVLNGLNLTIPGGARVGFVGTTGSGKSTTFDLLLGLLKPTEGELLVDGQTITGNYVRAWQQTIAHVPQSIYLADTSLAQNIAFGVPIDAIDFDRVQKAACDAQIADFIEGHPMGYNAVVGEHGIRLSGGQRQRIGIARALYKKARVLVFDEATSALDNATEQLVMDTIEGLDRDLTVLLIAHRLSTVQRCDMIVELEHGRVLAHGTYEELIEHSPSFRRFHRDRQFNQETTQF